MVILFDTIAEVIGVGHVHLRLHVTLVCRFHVPLEGFFCTLLHAFAVIVALAYVETAIDIIQLRSLHIPLKCQFKADLNASATLLADTKVVHSLGIARISLFAVIVCLVSLFWHSCYLFTYYLGSLWYVAPTCCVTGASEVMLDAVLENISLTFTARLRILLGTQHNGF